MEDFQGKQNTVQQQNQQNRNSPLV